MGNKMEKMGITSLREFTIYPKFEWETRLPQKSDAKGLHLPEGVRAIRFDPNQYQVCPKNTPELAAIAERLAAKGLKDPWLRNQVWLYDRKMWGQPYQRYFFPFRGMGIALGLVLIEFTLSKTVFKKEDDHHHHHEDKYPLLNEKKALH